MNQKIAFLLFAVQIQACVCFTNSPFHANNNGNQNVIATAIKAEEETTMTKDEITDSLRIPLSFPEMVQQVSSTMEDAYKLDKKRHIVRILLPRNSENEKLGVFSEGTPDAETQDIVLVPPDESWQGGIMQLYYSAAPSCEAILRRFTRNAAGGIPPKITEDRSVDESGVDGVGLWTVDLDTSEDSEKKSAKCFVQPSQEIIDAVEETSSDADLVMLLNPQWRSTDDLFDQASQEGGFFGQIASFLGGKGAVLKRLDDLGFESVYTFEGYICRGYKVRILKRFDSDWAMFCEKGAGFEMVGTSVDRPTYQQMEEKLEENGYGFRYAEQMGL